MIFSGFTESGDGDCMNPQSIIRYLQKHAIHPHAIVIPTQVHGKDIAIIDSELVQNIQNINLSPSMNPNVIHIDNTDGFVTTEPNIAICSYGADCLIATYSDNINGVIGVSHQGWKGTLHNMASAMIKKMLNVGAKRNTISVHLGPSIGPCCYKIYGERLSMFQKADPEIAKQSLYIHSRHEARLSLLHHNYLQLVRAGIPKLNISSPITCTKCDSSRWFSYQREGTGCPKMAAVIVNHN